MPATAARDDHPDRATPDRPTQQHRDGDRVTDGTESACVLLCVAFGDDRGWSIYGAERSQPVATGGKWVGPENGSDKRKPLPWVATSCRSERMVRRGSTVRVRQRASLTACKSVLIVVCVENARTHSGHICGTPDAPRRRKTPRDATAHEYARQERRDIPC